MTASPCAYIRRSTTDAGNPGDVSREVQEQAVRDLARADGHNGDVRLFVDWARSADEEKELRRTAFRAMLAAVERGEVSIIYAYALDRLARSTTTFARLLKAARDHDVRVVTQREGDLSDTGNPTSWAFGFLVSFFAEFELRMSKARAQSVAERRTARGDHFGKAPYGFRLVREDGGRVAYVPDSEQPLEPVLQAMREAGSVLGACRLLEARKIPAPLGGRAWSTASLGPIIQKHAPELMPRKGLHGRRTPMGASMLAQLIRCHCGQTMTPKPGGLYCYKGQKASSAVHGRMTVRTGHLLPWIQSEAGRFRVPFDAVTIVKQTSQRRLALDARREAIGWSVANGLIRDREKATAEVAEIDAELATLDDAEEVLDVPSAIDWTWEPKAINEVLRSLWEYVQLDADMKPVEAVWKVAEWRSGGV